MNANERKIQDGVRKEIQKYRDRKGFAVKYEKYERAAKKYKKDKKGDLRESLS